MNTHKTTASRPYDERVERRRDRLSNAIADRIRALKGDMSQRELAGRIDKSDSTVSSHLSGGVNLTLRTIARYEAALGEEVVTVPHLERPKRRRRRSASGAQRVSDEQRALADIDLATRRLHRLLTDVSARIGQALDAQEDLSQQALAEHMGKDPSYVSRVLGGGVNLTLKTVAQFEEALGICILRVKGRARQGRTETGWIRMPTAIRRSSDGGHYVDWHGTVTKSMTEYVSQQEEHADTESLACAEYA